MIISKNKIMVLRSEWECYVDTPDVVISEVNSFILNILNTNSDAVVSQRKIYNHLYENYNQYGFSDSECNQVVTNIVNKFYGTSIDRWASL